MAARRLNGGRHPSTGHILPCHQTFFSKAKFHSDILAAVRNNSWNVWWLSRCPFPTICVAFCHLVQISARRFCCLFCQDFLLSASGIFTCLFICSAAQMRFFSAVPYILFNTFRVSEPLACSGQSRCRLPSAAPGPHHAQQR